MPGCKPHERTCLKESGARRPERARAGVEPDAGGDNTTDRVSGVVVVAAGTIVEGRICVEKIVDIHEQGGAGQRIADEAAFSPGIAPVRSKMCWASTLSPPLIGAPSRPGGDGPDGTGAPSCDSCR